MGICHSNRFLLPGSRFLAFGFMYFCASDVKPGPLAKQSIVWKSFLGENWHTELQKAKAAANIKWQMARNGMGIKMHAIKSAK